MEEKTTKKEFIKKLELLAIKALHLLLLAAIFGCSWIVFRYKGFSDIPSAGFRYNYYIIIGYVVGTFLFYRTYNAFLLGYSKVSSLVFAQFLSQVFCSIIIYAAVSLAWDHFNNPLVLVTALVPQLLLDIIWSSLATRFYFRITPPKKTLIIYRNSLDKKRLGIIKDKPSEKLYQIAKELQYDGSFREIEGLLKEYDAVFVAGVNSRCRNGILKYCKENNIPGFFLPHVGDVIMQEAKHIQSFDAPVLNVERKVLNPEYAIVKRCFDFISSLLGIVVLSPILAITALAIKLYDGGPAIYKQVRLTKDGKEFSIYKFRSMRVDAEKDGIARLSTGENDTRITPIGRIVRKCRLDELPQLFNILKGDMSIVGPRPERPEIAEQYYNTMPDFKLRLQVKAGLTGYAQVYGKYNTDPYEKLEFDLLYINKMGILTDIRLVFATLSILFLPESTEGVDVGQVTALDYENEANRTEKWEKQGEHWAD